MVNMIYIDNKIITNDGYFYKTKRGLMSPYHLYGLRFKLSSLQWWRLY